MPVIHSTVITYTCDRCSYESKDAYDRGGCLSLKGEKTIKNNGGTGGGPLDIWMCGGCLEAFQVFMRGDIRRAI